MSILGLDVESRSAVDLVKCGAHVYWEDDTTDLWCASYAFDDEPVESWLPGMPCPPRVAEHVERGGVISAWNAAFERLAWNHRLGPKHGWPIPKLEQFECTAAAAAALSLPRALGQAAAALGIPQQKDDEGRRLMLRMAKPRKPRKGEDPNALLWWDEPEKIKRLAQYCDDDVEAERGIRKLLVPLSDAERDVYLLDQIMNDRGVYIDLDLVRAMKKITDDAKGHLDGRMAVATNWAVTACSQVKQLTEWLQQRGVPAESLAKAALDELLDIVDLPADARTALEIRKEAAKTSTAKLDAMLRATCRDGRARGLHLYHGASTGRWAGRLIQTQNMTRGTGTVKIPEEAVLDFLPGDVEWIDAMYGSPMSAVSDMLRSCISATPEGAAW